MIKLRNTGYNKHRIGLFIRLLLLVIELWILFILFNQEGHPVTKAILITSLIITLISLILYYDRPAKNFNRMLQGLEFREGTFKLRHGSKTLGLKAQEYLSRLTSAFSKIILEKESQAHFYENILRIIPCGILVISTDQKIRLYNDSLLRLLSMAEPISYGKLNKLYPELMELFISFKNGQQVVQKIKIHGLNTWVSITGSNIRIEGKNHQVFAIEDVQRVANQKELETWEEMAKIITHEIKNSLSPIRLLLGQLANWFRSNSDIIKLENYDKDLGSKLISTLISTEKRTTGLIEFVDGYKKLLHLPSPELKNISVSQLLHDSIDIMQPQIKPLGIKITSNCIEKIAINVDFQQMTQVMMNLIGNSIHFLSNTENPEIKLIGRIGPMGVSILVEDNGPGIPTELQEQVFIPFFSTRSGGTGIGLSFARKVISKHHGVIRLSSRPGSTIIMIQLPN
ncbi:MAG: hypothetical protein HN352_05600 [Bacteroidetes bacterium]|jgi:two-component system, NtrC family, nitrogen regulation sensor histidine kinase NtrY|nr:hypothetical protein [Bacteroidota bacterium]MBT3748519.1 hypothetical protein [Bacteroidota bacterium]MBT4399668.1 hypothetical protein [Bacteroidota bacterium]MBT4409555.1 hypothetical protein [Bacteroidota bacterium]MBT5427781.1 hypothetical protein [Bacteroidota bacterium]